MAQLGEIGMNPPRLITLVVALVVVIAVIWYTQQ
jgi:hypothetical protein